MRRTKPTPAVVCDGSQFSLQLTRLALGPSGVRHARNLRINVFPQPIPDILRYLEERFDYIWIKLPAAPAGDFVACCLVALLRSIDAVDRHGIQRIGYRKDSCSERNFLSLQAARITCTVVALLVRIDDVTSINQKRDLLHDLVSLIAVLLHDGHLVGSQLAGLSKDGIRNCQLTDVVEKCAAGDGRNLLWRQAHGLRNHNSEGSNSPRMSLGLRVFHVERIA